MQHFVCLGIFQVSGPTVFIRCLWERCSICPLSPLPTLSTLVCARRQTDANCKDRQIPSGFRMVSADGELRRRWDRTGHLCPGSYPLGPLKASRDSQLMVPALVRFLRLRVVVMASCLCPTDPQGVKVPPLLAQGARTVASLPLPSFVNSPFKTVYYTDGAICLRPGPQECLRG